VAGLFRLFRGPWQILRKWLFSGPGVEARAGYGAAVRLMWETSHPLSFAVAGYAIAASIMPNLVLIAAGHLVGSIPAAAASGLSLPRFPKRCGEPTPSPKPRPVPGCAGLARPARAGWPP
jgi:hypothetical protein